MQSMMFICFEFTVLTYFEILRIRKYLSVAIINMDKPENIINTFPTYIIIQERIQLSKINKYAIKGWVNNPTQTSDTEAVISLELIFKCCFVLTIANSKNPLNITLKGIRTINVIIKTFRSTSDNANAI